MTSTGLPETDLRSAGTDLKSELSELSRERVRRGAIVPSQLAAWASDVHALEELLWENGLGDGPDPRSQLAAVGEAVAASVVARARSVSGDVSVRHVVELAREAMSSTFDGSVSELLADRMMSLDHLDGCDDAPPLAEAGEERSGRRPGARTAEALVAALRVAAADSFAVAETLAKEGDEAGAQQLALHADAASFQAYLVAAADRAGDHGLTTVDLRWDLAAALELPAVISGSGLAGTVLDRRRQLSRLVGSGESRALELSFVPLTQE